MAKYKMTKYEYNLLEREYRRLGMMLENAEIILPNGRPKNFVDLSGVLDEEKFKQLMGNNSGNVWYYNFDNNKWYTNNLVTDGFFHKRYNTTNVKELKRVIDAQYSDIEVAGCVVMPVSTQKYPLLSGNIIHNPVFCQDGLGAVGTVVCRDAKSKQFIQIVGWIGLAEYESKYQVMQAAMSKLAVECARNYTFRQTLLGKYK